MTEKHALTMVPINDIISRRWSPRAYDKDKQVSREQILALCEAARWSPNCFNDQPFRYIIANKFTNNEAWTKCFNTLLGFNKLWAVNAPVFFICLSHNNFRHNNALNDWAGYDSGAASQSICLQAVDLGLIAHQIAGFDAKLIKENFNIKDNLSLHSIIVVGYQAPVSVLPEELALREDNPRERLNLNELFFDGDLSKGII
jgi:nitroreductase